MTLKSHSVRSLIMVILFALTLARPATGEVRSGWKTSCVVAVVAAATIFGAIQLNHQMDRTVIKQVIARASGDVEILSADTQSKTIAELLLVGYGQSGTYLVRPPSLAERAQEYLVSKKWMKPRYRQDPSVAFQIFDYVDRYNRDPKVRTLLQELRGLPYGTLDDEEWFEIGIKYFGETLPNYELKSETYGGLAWEENPNLRYLWNRSRTGFTDDERQGLVPYLMLENHKYSGNRDVMHLLRNAPGFLEAVQEQPTNYADWIKKAAGHLKKGDEKAAKVVGHAMRRIATDGVIDILKALGPECFRTFLLESRDTRYIAEALVSKDIETYRPILRGMLRSRDPKEAEIAKEICEKVPELISEIP